jgi:lysophospholipase L1-like esterase
MRKYINDAKAKGATAIVCSPIPRNGWRDGKVGRSSESYGKWAGDVAKSEKVHFIDLNELVAAKYEAMGMEAVKPLFPVERDATHTGIEGAKLNAEIVVKEIKDHGPKPLAKFLK